ncbi:MAG: HDIG domain-containing metalloprotein [Ignavibacteriales bacterium]
MERSEIVNTVKYRLPNVNLFKHCLAVEAVMRGLARRFAENEEDWGLAGLLHDIDYEETKNDPDRHSLLSGEIVRGMGFGDEIVDAVIAHNERHGLPRDTRMAKALYACDPLTGLIVAAALIHPEKKLSAIDTAFILHRYKEKSFAKGANRKTIEACSDLGLSLEEFVTIGLESMTGIARELGL